MNTAFDKTLKWIPILLSHFDRRSIQAIRKKKDGIIISDFYLWLLLESAKSDGRLRLSKRYPYNASNLAEITDYEDDVLVKGLFMLEEMDLITTVKSDDPHEDGTIIVNEFVELKKLIESMKKTDTTNGLSDNDDESTPRYKVGEEDE